MSRPGSSPAGAALILKRLRVPANVRRHSVRVRRKALFLAKRIAARGKRVDLRLVSDGALLHDAGRVETHGLAHGVAGAKILRELGAGERLAGTGGITKAETRRLARICETHVLGGITRAEARRLGLPAKDYLPRTIEEKIVCAADKLAEGRAKFRRIARHVGKRSVLYKRMLRLISEVEAAAGIRRSF